MIDRGYLAYFAFICDIIVALPFTNSIPVVCEFLDVFPIDLPGVPPNWDIDFSIDIKSGTKPISVNLYSIAPAKLKELKEQVYDL